MNTFKTFMLIAALTALFGVIGLLISGQMGMIIALLLATVMNLGSYWFSDKIVLKMYGAKPLYDGPIYDMTLRLAKRASLPMPKVYIIDSPQPNAFATGRNPQHAAVAVNTGLVSLLSDEELAGVIAHELAHIKNSDTLIMTITATIAGGISSLAHFAVFFGGRHSNDEEGGSSSPLVGFLVMLLAPLAAMLVQMAISRTREYAADRTASEISGAPLSLANALSKLEHTAKRIDNPIAESNPATAHMFIINPLHARRMDSLFSTHPNTQNRIDALKQMAQDLGSKR